MKYRARVRVDLTEDPPFVGSCGEHGLGFLVGWAFNDDGTAKYKEPQESILYGGYWYYVEVNTEEEE